MRLIQGTRICYFGEWTPVEFGKSDHRMFLARIAAARKLNHGDRPKSMCCGATVYLDEIDVAICPTCFSTFIYEEEQRLILKNFPYVKKEVLKDIAQGRHRDSEKDIVRDSVDFKIVAAAEKASKKDQIYFDIQAQLLDQDEGMKGHCWFNVSPEWGDGARFRDFCHSIGMGKRYRNGEVTAADFEGLQGSGEIKRTRDWRHIEFMKFTQK